MSAVNVVETKLAWSGTPAALNPANIDAIVLHHRAGNGDIESIHKQHRDANGWCGIGYHYYVRKDGKIYRGRPENWIGAHAGASVNPHTLSICFEGCFHVASGIPTDKTMPEPQFLAGVMLIQDIRKRRSKLEVKRHRDYMATGCPGDFFPYDKMLATLNGAATDELPAKTPDVVSSENVLDNTPDSYAADAVKWAIDNGILKGDGKGNYNLHDNVTRQDALVFQYRAFQNVVDNK